MIQGEAGRVYLQCQSQTTRTQHSDKMSEKMKTFILDLGKGAINQNTVVNGSKITTEERICKVMRAEFCKRNGCKSLTDWANQLNATGEYDGTFTKFDALDSLSSMFNLNIDGKYVAIYQFYQKHLPFTK